MDLFGLLVTIIILAIVFYLVYWVISQIPLPDPFKTVIMAVLGLIAILVLIGLLTGNVSIPILKMHT